MCSKTVFLAAYSKNKNIICNVFKHVTNQELHWSCLYVHVCVLVTFMLNSLFGHFCSLLYTSCYVVALLLCSCFSLPTVSS